jgi:hypothetical protein
VIAKQADQRMLSSQLILIDMSLNSESRIQFFPRQFKWALFNCVAMKRICSGIIRFPHATLSAWSSISIIVLIQGRHFDCTGCISLNDAWLLFIWGLRSNGPCRTERKHDKLQCELSVNHPRCGQTSPTEIKRAAATVIFSVFRSVIYLCFI